jgi:hypothetical protein
MFIFVTAQELWVRKLIGCIIGYDHSLGQKDIYSNTTGKQYSFVGQN